MTPGEKHAFLKGYHLTNRDPPILVKNSKGQEVKDSNNNFIWAYSEGETIFAHPNETQKDGLVISWRTNYRYKANHYLTKNLDTVHEYHLDTNIYYYKSPNTGHGESFDKRQCEVVQNKINDL